MKTKLIQKFALLSVFLSVTAFNYNLPIAQAGPCANRGCVGQEGSCGVEYTVIEIGDIKITRSCDGTKSSPTPPVIVIPE